MSELRVLMTECCVHRDMNVAKKSVIINVLKRDPARPGHPDFLLDARVLAAGLLHVMMSPPYDSPGAGSNSTTTRCVAGKHVIVTLGDQGLLWVSSSGEAMGWDGKARSTSNDIVEMDNNTFAR